MAILAFELRPCELVSEPLTEEAKPSVEVLELVGDDAPDVERPGAGSGVGDVDEGIGLMAKLRVETLL